MKEGLLSLHLTERTCTHIHAHTHTHICAHTHSHTCTHSHTHMHTHTHTETETHTHTHTHAPPYHPLEVVSSAAPALVLRFRNTTNRQTCIEKNSLYPLFLFLSSIYEGRAGGFGEVSGFTDEQLCRVETG